MQSEWHIPTYAMTLHKAMYIPLSVQARTPFLEYDNANCIELHVSEILCKQFVHAWMHTLVVTMHSKCNQLIKLKQVSNLKRNWPVHSNATRLPPLHALWALHKPSIYYSSSTEIVLGWTSAMDKLVLHRWRGNALERPKSDHSSVYIVMKVNKHVIRIRARYEASKPYTPGHYWRS